MSSCNGRPPRSPDIDIVVDVQCVNGVWMNTMMNLATRQTWTVVRPCPPGVTPPATPPATPPGTPPPAGRYMTGVNLLGTNQLQFLFSDGTQQIITLPTSTNTGGGGGITDAFQLTNLCAAVEACSSGTCIPVQVI